MTLLEQLNDRKIAHLYQPVQESTWDEVENNFVYLT